MRSAKCLPAALWPLLLHELFTVLVSQRLWLGMDLSCNSDQLGSHQRNKIKDTTKEQCISDEAFLGVQTSAILPCAGSTQLCRFSRGSICLPVSDAKVKPSSSDGLSGAASLHQQHGASGCTPRFYATQLLSGTVQQHTLHTSLGRPLTELKGSSCCLKHLVQLSRTHAGDCG